MAVGRRPTTHRNSANRPPRPPADRARRQASGRAHVLGRQGRRSQRHLAPRHGRDPAGEEGQLQRHRHHHDRPGQGGRVGAQHPGRLQGDCHHRQAPARPRRQARRRLPAQQPRVPGGAVRRRLLRLHAHPDSLQPAAPRPRRAAPNYKSRRARRPGWLDPAGRRHPQRARPPPDCVDRREDEQAHGLERGPRGHWRQGRRLRLARACARLQAHRRRSAVRRRKGTGRGLPLAGGRGQASGDCRVHPAGRPLHPRTAAPLHHVY